MFNTARISTNFNRGAARRFPGAQDVIKPIAGSYGVKKIEKKVVWDFYCETADMKTNMGPVGWFDVLQNIGLTKMHQRVIGTDAEGKVRLNIHFSFIPIDGLENVRLYLYSPDRVEATLWARGDRVGGPSRKKLAEYLYSELFAFLRGNVDDAFEHFIRRPIAGHIDAIHRLDLETNRPGRDPETNAHYRFSLAYEGSLGEPKFEYDMNVERDEPILCGGESLDDIKVFDVGYRRKIELPALEKKLGEMADAEDPDATERFLFAVDEYLAKYMRQTQNCM